MPTDSLLLIGAGGHACAVFDAMRCADPESIVIVRDDNPQASEKLFFGLRPRTPVEFKDDEPIVVHVAIGNNETRCILLSRAERSGRQALTIIHPRSTVSVYATIGSGAFIAAGAVIAPGAVVGRGAIINHGAIVDHDCQVGDCAHVAPNATLGGSVQIGAGVLIGAGAVILPGCVVGDGGIVGAGAVVLHDVGAKTRVAGNPARLLPDYAKHL